MFKCHIYQLLGLLPQMPDEKWGSKSPGNPHDNIGVIEFVEQMADFWFKDVDHRSLLRHELLVEVVLYTDFWNKPGYVFVPKIRVQISTF